MYTIEISRSRLTCIRPISILFISLRSSFSVRYNPTLLTSSVVKLIFSLFAPPLISLLRSTACILTPYNSPRPDHQDRDRYLIIPLKSADWIAERTLAEAAICKCGEENKMRSILALHQQENVRDCFEG